MMLNRKVFGTFSALLMVLGALLFIISFSTMAWSVGYDSAERIGIWRECSRHEGDDQVECGGITPSGCVRAVQWMETLALVMMLTGMLLMTFRMLRAPHSYIILQMMSNIFIGLLVLVGLIIHKASTPMPTPGYSFYLALFTTMASTVAAILNFLEYRDVRSRDSLWGHRLIDTMNVHI